MKVIQVVGRSNSGKTHFIHSLLERMTVMFPGKVGVIKHLGHHNFDLAKGKDTTTHYEHGAECVAGVDAEKTVLTVRNDDLGRTLEILCNLGMDYAIIEGFKSYGYKKIVKGELESDECLLRDPTVDEVIESIDEFDDYNTLNGLVSQFRNDKNLPEGCCIVTYSGIIEDSCNPDMDKADLIRKAEECEGVYRAEICFDRNQHGEGNTEILIAVAAYDRKAAFYAIESILSRIK